LEREKRMKEEDMKGWCIIGLSIVAAIAFIAICLTFFGLPLWLLLSLILLKRRARKNQKERKREKAEEEIPQKIPYGRRG